MKALRSLVAPVMILLIVTACATPKQRPTSQSHWDPSSRLAPALVEVTNYNWNDAVVYLLANGRRIRLGDVTSMDTGRFKVDSDALLATDLRLHVRLIGPKSDFTTERVLLNPGQRMSMQVENALTQTTYFVR